MGAYIHGHISMRQKHRQEWWATRAMWWPRVARLREVLVIRRPWRGSRKGFASAMASKLSGFEFNPRRDWWQAPLTVENYRAMIEQFEDQVNLSDGVQEWAEAQGEVVDG